MNPEWLGVWTNEMHADYLAHDRLAEARAHAARQAIVAEVRRLQWLAVRRLTSRPSRRWSHR
jgi:hypothetical protein